MLQAVAERDHLDADTMIPVLANVLGLPLPEQYAPLSGSSQRQRGVTIAALQQWIVGDADNHPVLFVMEDVHWADPSSLEILAFEPREDI